ncbi:hypothetical protein ASF84_25145 [Pseudomonas sp. Leaf127]|uniref:class I SAM-dependent methyltransferase n=1 Tax=Pseudomonas sp. Leaf127 TaxID=1736267 RepID=UPI0007029984|nr:methyltransferase domain-containing protein [Pseudomonas sp. Leaf127]KQQ65577.1 hypothetical protein ASF84_25145 [Pseudomonas sp. Leaf127]
MSGLFYRAFEDRHRGSRELIHERQQIYVPFLEPLKQLYPERKALDVGCGRGEWLEILQRNGFDPLGVDLDAGMLQACHDLGLPVEQGDALEMLKRMPDESLAVVSGFHVAEHIPFDVLKDLVSETMRVLKPGGLLILETPNAENLVVGAQYFYLDPSHERPIPHLLLSFLTEYCGFERSKVLRLQEPAPLVEGDEVNLVSVLFGVSPDYAIVAQKQAPAEQMQTFDAAFERDYGLSLDLLATRYDHQVSRSSAQIEHLEAAVRELAALNASHHAQLHELSQRAEQAHLRCQQIEEFAVGQVEQRHLESLRVNAEIEHMRVQNQAYQAQISALLSSSSWRLTRPLRVGLRAARWGLRLPKRGMRSVLFRSMRFVLDRPVLTLRVNALIKAHPGLFQKARQFALDHGFIEPSLSELNPNIMQADEDEFAHPSPRVAHVYAELKQAFERKENR